MSLRAFLLVLVLLPIAAWAQERTSPPAQGSGPINAITRSVVLANRPAQFTAVEWLRMMEQPVNHSLYPLRITQGMLDTLDARQLDPRFHYLMVRDMNDPSHEGVH